MHGNTKLILWIALLSAIVFSAAVKWAPVKEEKSRLQRIPIAGSLYASQALPLSQTESSVFGQARVIKRFYRFGRHGFMMIVVDGSANRHAVHDPLYCLRGDGWQINTREEIAIDGGAADLLRLSRKGVKREAVFWYSDSSSRHASIIRYWLQTTLRRLTFGQSALEPVMVILQSTGDEKPDWRTILDQCGFLFEI